MSSEPSTAGEGVGNQVAALIAPCPVGQWCIETPPAFPTSSPPLLHSVFAVSADNVFAVGDSGTILHRSSSAWTVMPSGTTNHLRGVWAASASDVWAVGIGGTVLHYNGTAWSPVPGGPTTDVDAVWGSSASDVWLVGSGVVTHWNGATFLVSKNVAGSLLSVSGTGPADVWTAGDNTSLNHFTGAKGWATVDPMVGTNTMFCVLAVAPGDVWVTDFTSNKETSHLTGTTWTPKPTGGVVFQGMAARSSTDIWAVGGTRVGHWNGSAWTITQAFGNTVGLWSVATTTGHAWIVGDNAFIAHQAF